MLTDAQIQVKPVVPETPVSARSARSVDSSTIGSGSSSASSVTVGNPVETVDNLLDQLQTSHETRFHACWMFLRYFYLLMTSESSRFRAAGPDGLYRSKLEQEGRELVVLDISVACLSLSVKFHRDFLEPLLPVYANEYLVLSPHGMSYDDLEVVCSLACIGRSYSSN